MAERIDRIGQRFGDYWLRRRLGGGSFGDVYLGEQVHEHSLAAVKVLHIRLTRSEELRAFINEVRTFRLQHPHIVRVLDVGIAQDETPFLVMEYAPRGTLRDRHPKGSRLSQAQVLGYVLPVASALQYAHDLHLIHRDVKPENMLLGAKAELWLSDFGIATVAHSTHSLTTEAMGGTLLYMAPEQIQGRPRPQSDQYALAIVVYEWLTGTWPFRGTALEIAMQHQMTPPPALRTQVPTLAPEVEQVVLTALAKEPKQRFASVLDFARALEQASQVEQSTLVEPPSVQPAPPALQMPVPLPSVPLVHDVKGGLLEEERVQNIEEQTSPKPESVRFLAPVFPMSGEVSHSSLSEFLYRDELEILRRIRRNDIPASWKVFRPAKKRLLWHSIHYEWDAIGGPITGLSLFAFLILFFIAAVMSSFALFLVGFCSILLVMGCIIGILSWRAATKSVLVITPDQFLWGNWQKEHLEKVFHYRDYTSLNSAEERLVGIKVVTKTKARGTEITYLGTEEVPKFIHFPSLFEPSRDLARTIADAHKQFLRSNQGNA